MMSGPGGLEDTAAPGVLRVCIMFMGCLGQIFVVGRVFWSPPGLPEADSIVWSGRTGRHRHTQCLAGLLLIVDSSFDLG